MSDTPLAALADEKAIERLLTDYAALNDERDFEGLSDLLVEACQIRLPSAPEVVLDGKAAVLTRFRDRPPRTACHVISNVVVTLTGPATATVRSRSLLVAKENAAPATVSVARFDDEVVKTDGRWRFRRRAGTPLV